MTLNNKQPNSEYTDLESFFPLKMNRQSKQNNKSDISGKSIKKMFLIQRRSSNSDIWICNSCTWTGDRWFMEKHPCKQNISNNFAKCNAFRRNIETNKLLFNSSSNEIFNKS